jgi:methylmalonyl-CoA mutase N-terminal domain/subunit
VADEERLSPSGVPIEPFYRPQDGVADYGAELGDPGTFPYTRGVQPTMYRGRLWTMRQYAGFGTAAETNTRFRHLLAAGQTGLSVAFDLPTQMGIDSDSPRAAGEVGRVGVAIDTVEDMHVLLDSLPLDTVSTSMTINATAATLLAMYIIVAEERGIPREKLSGTIQNDILKEYIARGTYIYPPSPSLALIAETFRFCAEEVPSWNPISISGYHIREAGSTAAQELAFTFANMIEYVEGALAAGLAIDRFAPRLSFFFAAHNDLFEEVAKFRAARRIYARIMRDRFGASDAGCRLRFHTQTGGVTLMAQQPLNNIVRVAVQALAAVRSRCTQTGTTRLFRFPPPKRQPSPFAHSRSSRTSRGLRRRRTRSGGVTTSSISPRSSSGVPPTSWGESRHSAGHPARSRPHSFRTRSPGARTSISSASRAARR